MTTTPGPIGPYRPVVRAGDLLFTSGQLGAVPGDDGRTVLVDPDPCAQLRQALDNLEAVLSSEDAGINDIVKATLFVTDLRAFASLNEIWVERFAHPRPARSTVEVAALPMGAAVEVEAIAYSPRSSAT